MNKFEVAQSQAKIESLPLLLIFSGSDWCSWCMKLESEVLKQPEFVAWAKDHVVMLTVDFPENHPLPEAEKVQNIALAKRYGVEYFPTVIVCDADGQEIARTGYTPGGPASFIALLEKELKK